MNGPAHEILILNAHAQKPPFSANTDVSSGVGYLTFGLSLQIQLYFANVINKGSGESCASAQARPSLRCSTML